MNKAIIKALEILLRHHKFSCYQACNDEFRVGYSRKESPELFGEIMEIIGNIKEGYCDVSFTIRNEIININIKLKEDN